MTQTEENYLKAIYHLAYEHQVETKPVGTNELADFLSVKPATVNSMLKKLSSQSFIHYQKYTKIQLTEFGRLSAIQIIRKHRLWETFLYEKLDFTWDEVHEIAEELEHIHSEKLISKLDQFLNFPKMDPHGDPIPNHEGIFPEFNKKTLSDILLGENCRLVAVKDNTRLFLKYVVSLGLGINNKIKLISREDFDQSVVIEVDGKRFSVSKKFCDNIFVSTEI